MAAAAVLVSRGLDGGPAIARLQRASVPLEAALSNGRPTVLEFYADWCAVCSELAPATLEVPYYLLPCDSSQISGSPPMRGPLSRRLQVEEEYKDRVNFVLLNVENTKWTPEIAEYGVRGIPHYVFLDGKGAPQAAAVGRLPREVRAHAGGMYQWGRRRRMSLAACRMPCHGAPATGPPVHTLL